MPFSIKRFIPIVLLVLIGLTILIAFPSKTFILDDFHVIQQNPYVGDIKFIPYYLDQFFNRSVFYISLIIDHALWGMNHQAFYISNLLIHIVNSVLFFLIMNHILNVHRPEERVQWYSFLCAVIFLIHPIQFTTIRQVANRSIMLCTLFYFVGILSFLKMRKGRTLKQKTFFGAMCFCSYLLSTASKSVGVTLPIILVLSEIVFFRSAEKKSKSTLIWIVLSLCLVPILSYILIHETYIVQNINIPVVHNLLTQAVVLFRYLFLVIVPLNIVPEYIQAIKTGFDLQVFAAMGGILFLIIIVCKTSRKMPLIAFSILFFLITLSPSSSLIPRGNPMLIYRLYIAIVGFILLIVELFVRSQHKVRRRFVRITGICIFSIYLVLLVLGTVLQGLLMQDNLTMWSHISRMFPNNHVPYYNIGSIYLRKKNVPDALQYLKKAESIDPYYSRTLYNLGTAYMIQGNWDSALQYFKQATEVNPQNHTYQVNIANCYVQKREYATALEHYNAYLKKSPNDVRVYNNAFYCLYELEEYRTAIEYMNIAIALVENKIYVLNKTRCLIELAHYDEAIKELEYVIHNYGENEESLFQLALCHQSLDQQDTALVMYEKILRMNPNHIGSLNNSAIILLQKGATDEAQSRWQHILEIDSHHLGARTNIERIQ